MMIKEKIINIYNWTKDKIKRFWKWFLLLLIPVAIAAPLVFNGEPSHIYQKIEWTRPTTDAEWAEDVKKESLHFKHDYQLDEMEISHINKLPQPEKDLKKFIECPECIKWELKQEFSREDFELEGKTVDEWIEEEFESQLAYYKWKTDKLNQTIERIKKEKELRDKKKVERTPIGTVYYIDADCGTPGDGTDSECDGADGDDSYDELDDFTEVGRVAGDVAILKRGTTATYDNGSDLTFTSDGTNVNPIFIEADYANAFSTDVDLSGTATATLTFGSTTVTFASDISGVLDPGDWIYETNDNQKDFAYEVSGISGGSNEIATLYLPYKGDNAGSGKTMINMQAAPVWGTDTSFNFQWDFDLDHNWKVQGIQIQGTDGNGNIELNSSGGHVFKDLILLGNDIGDTGIKCTDDACIVKILKIRGSNHTNGTLSETVGGGGFAHLTFIKDSILDTITVGRWANLTIEESYTDTITLAGSTYQHSSPNVLLRNTTGFGLVGPGTRPYVQLLSEDHNGTVGDTKAWLASGADLAGVPFYQSETTKVRGGGSTISIEVRPTDEISTNWEFSQMKVLELPFYATTDSKTYTVYFASDDNTDWDADPTATELWVECEYWGHAANNFRQIKKSTGTVDFQTDTDFDQTLTVTCQPAQAGVLYLRVYYAKTLEGGNANIFYVDPIPDVS